MVVSDQDNFDAVLPIRVVKYIIVQNVRSIPLHHFCLNASLAAVPFMSFCKVADGTVDTNSQNFVDFTNEIRGIVPS